MRLQLGVRPDLVIGSSPQLFAALAAERLAARLGVPFVLEVRDLWPESLVAAGGRKGAFYVALAAIASYLYRRAEHLIVLSRGNVDYLAARGIPRSRITYIPNGVDPGAFASVRRETRAGLRLIYAGAHGPANGLETVLDAAALLRDDDGIRFLLLGDGPVKEALVARARAMELANVEFRDPVSKDDLPTIFSECDAGLMVLRDSPLFAFGVSPNKLFDYLGARLPVVCNVPGEVASMVADSGAGVQAADASAQALAGAIRDLSRRDPGTRALMGESGRRWVTAEHGRAALAERLDAALRPLVRRWSHR